ncbi:CBS domain-containing protein [Sulfitobacter sp. F26169L]|uniref:CBS domain-containing protein n=1 Tax=Sulfitobacter sp. F26169L TaxID=2996015 RepID=UPI002260DBCF|nr:CBS domain-containing protein [Sulfitobacter sp. F26169L]MCX7568231.1 CBS domain-containing protein [Sulfitobacter sp. F26169L]
MRTPVTVISPETPVRAAAALMAELGLGALPVCESDKLVGILTDRDIVVRWASRISDDSPVAPIMSRNVVTCQIGQLVEHAAYLMSDMQIRRLVVLDEAELVVGIITVGDIANDACETLAGQTLGEIVELR